MPIFSQKVVHSLKNKLLHVILTNFHEKTTAVMPIFGPQYINFAKTTLYYGPKKSIECLFFQKNFREYPIITAKKSETPLQNTL